MPLNSLYKSRMSIWGTNDRDREKKWLGDYYNRISVKNPSYRDEKINGKPDKLFINYGTQSYYKEFNTAPGQIVYAGDYVQWDNSIWIVEECMSSEDELYLHGQLWECNCLLRWQNRNGEIVERWAHIISASKYNDGTNSNGTMTLGSDQAKVYLPVDDETLDVSKIDQKKIVVDNSTREPSVYEITNPANVYSTFTRDKSGKIHGVTDWIIKETAYTFTDEDRKHGVAGWVDPTPNPNEKNDVTNKVTITGSDVLKYGKMKTYTASEWDDSWNWNVVSVYNLTVNISDNSISVKATDKLSIGTTIKIQILSGDEVLAVKSVQIENLY